VEYIYIYVSPVPVHGQHGVAHDVGCDRTQILVRRRARTYIYIYTYIYILHTGLYIYICIYILHTGTRAAARSAGAGVIVAAVRSSSGCSVSSTS
jgi:hypothetical protein